MILSYKGNLCFTSDFSGVDFTRKIKYKDYFKAYMLNSKEKKITFTINIETV